MADNEFGFIPDENLQTASTPQTQPDQQALTSSEPSIDFQPEPSASDTRTIARPGRMTSRTVQLRQAPTAPIQRSVNDLSPEEQVAFKEGLLNNPPTSLSAVILGIGQGTMSDFGDDLAESVTGKVGSARMDETELRYPIPTNIGRFIGAFIPGAASYKAAKGALVALQNSPKIQSLLSAAISGGILNGSFTLGQADEIDSKTIDKTVKEIGKGAVLGGFFAGAAPSVFNAFRGSSSFEAMLNGVAAYGGRGGERVAAKIFSSELATKAGNIATDLATLGALGGTGNVIMQGYEDREKALKDFQTGASYALVAGLAGKSILGTVKTLNKYVTKGAQKQYDTRITLEQSRLDSTTNSLKIAEQGRRTAQMARTTSKKSLKEAQTELDLVRRQQSKIDGLLEAEDVVSNRVATANSRLFKLNTNRDVGEETISALQKNIDELGSRKQSVLQTMKDVDLDVTTEVAQFKNALNNVRRSTTFQDRSLEQAQGALNRLEQNMKIVKTNPIAGPVRTTFKTNPADLDRDIREISDLLYNRSWLSEASKPIKDAITSFERGVVRKINSADSSGQVADLNEAMTSLFKTSRVTESTLNISFFNTLSKNPKAPQVKEFLNKFDTTAARVKAIKDPVLRNQIETFFKVARSEIDQSATDYAALNTAKREAPRMARRADLIEEQIQRRAERASKERLSFQRAQQAEKQAGINVRNQEVVIEDMLGRRPNNMIEALIPERARILSETAEAFRRSGSVREGAAVAGQLGQVVPPASIAAPSTLGVLGGPATTEKTQQRLNNFGFEIRNNLGER